MIGRVIEPDEKGECPECGPFISTHDEYKADDCGHFVAHPGARNGFHCPLPIDHNGPCRPPE